MQKNILSETSIVTGTVSNKSLLKHQMVKNHVMNNFSLSNKIKDDQYWHLEDYITLPYHQHLQWFEDYIRDHYRSEYNRTLIKLPDPKLGNRAIVQQKGEQINYNHYKHRQVRSCELTVKGCQKWGGISGNKPNQMTQRIRQPLPI